ncbi:MAG TPA: COX15/CtaA family protein [Candidatus Limnocylindria bacterium]|jgi:cytochrome c oxidase assembly protein subunit 15|nr:COX15/CtaA family protein [Candidatus Limnocylindria bacterium]
MPTGHQDNKWLYRYAVFAACCTLLLVCVGGMVTSKGVGMAVPDWPTTYGYNMFLFPFSKMIGGIFWEHLHRLKASGVGLLTLGLAAWIFFFESRNWVKKLGFAAAGMVIIQGVLGGLRVMMDKEVVANTTLGTVFGLVHACTGQAFFVLMCVLAFALSPAWARFSEAEKSREQGARRLRWLIPVATVAVFIQLALGAAMRHQHSGLAVPDFPMAYGQVWPATDAESLLRYNQRRADTEIITAFQIWLHMFHRLNACVVALLIGLVAVTARKLSGAAAPVRKAAFLWAGLVVLQFSLGIVTVLYDKPADIATAHVAVGALTLALGGLLICGSRLLLSPWVPLRNPEDALSKPAKWVVNPG